MKNNIFFLLALVLFSSRVFSQTQIQDADGNTKVQTEATPNDNTIRLIANGSNLLQLSKSPTGQNLIQVFDVDENLYLGLNAGLNSTGHKNTVVGQGTGFNLNTGFSNTLIGHSAGAAINTGGFNTAVGQNAAFSNTSGSSNVSVGYASLQNNQTGQQNVALGDFALAGNTTSFNTAVGSSALQSNTSGGNNVAVGRRAGQANTTGGSNLFVGESAGLNNTTGSSNTFLGKGAGQANTGTSGNTFIGAEAGKLNVGGDAHVFVGKSAGAATVNNSTNTYIGSETGLSSTSGFNTYVGGLAGRNNTTGGSNTFLGAFAGQNTSTGSNNVVLGTQAGFSMTTGSSNVLVGKSAGGNFNSNNCTFLGTNASATANGFTNSTALGNGATVNASNKIRFGNLAVSVVEGAVAYTVSDGRFKSNIQNDAPGLDFVMGLRPVTYQFDYSQFSKFLGETNVDHGVLTQKDQKREMGFVAQDVERLCLEQGLAVSNLVHSPENEVDNYSVAYGQMVVPLVRAVQEQQAQIESQRLEIEELKSLVSQLIGLQIPRSLDFQLWPNPTTGEINLLLNEVLEGTQMCLYSKNGTPLRDVPARAGMQQLDLKNLPAGMYFLRANAPGQLPVTKSVVKSN